MIFVFLVFLFSLLPAFLHGSEKFNNLNENRPRYSSELEVVNEFSRVIHGKPGEVLSVSFKVTNKTDRLTEFSEALVLPDGWNSELPLGAFHLPGKVEQSRYAAFKCPAYQPAGTYRVEYLVSNNRNPDQQSSTYCLVTIVRSKPAKKQKDKAKKKIENRAVKTSSDNQPKWFVPNPTQAALSEESQEPSEVSEEKAENANEKRSDLSTDNGPERIEVEERLEERLEDQTITGAKLKPEAPISKIENKITFKDFVDDQAKDQDTFADEEKKPIKLEIDTVSEQSKPVTTISKKVVKSSENSGFLLANPTQQRALIPEEVAEKNLEELEEEPESFESPKTSTDQDDAVATEFFEDQSVEEMVEAYKKQKKKRFGLIESEKEKEKEKEAVFIGEGAKHEASAKLDEKIEEKTADQKSIVTKKEVVVEFESGSSSDISVKMITPTRFNLLPGELVSHSFLITNETNVNLELVENIELPDGFRSLLPADTLSLAPGETQPGILSFTVPKDAKAGNYSVTYNVQSQDQPTVRNFAKFEFSVNPVSKIRMFMENVPTSLIAGQDQEATVMILNEGNVEFKALIRPQQGRGYRVKIDPEVISLNPGESLPVKLTIDVSENVRDFRKVIVNLKAINLADDSEFDLGTVSQGMSIFPKDAESINLDRVIPSRLLLRTNGDGSRRDFQTELSGAGNLDQAGKKRINFLVRTPDQENLSIFGLREEFRLNYEDEKLVVRTGDQSYQLSYLTDYYRYGRGFSADYKVTDETEIGYYSLNTRWETPKRSQGGFHISHEFNENIIFKFNYLSKDLPNTSIFKGEKARVSSLEMDLAPSKKSSLHVEIGRSEANNSVADGKRAHQIEYAADLENKTNLRLTKTYADKGYGGYLENVDNHQGYLTFPVSNKISGFVNYSKNEQQIDLSKVSKFANLEKRLQFGANFILDNTLSGNVNLETLSRFDKLLPSDYDYDEFATRVSLSKRWEKLSLRWDTRRARRTDNILAAESYYNSHNYYLTYRQSTRFDFSVYGGFTNYAGENGYGSSRDFNNIGINAHWKPSEKLDVRFWYLKYKYENAENRVSQGDLSISYELEKDCTISFRARNNLSWQANEGPTYYEIVYYMPLDIPVGKNMTIGAIRGKVFDIDNENKPLGKMTLTLNGKAAVTNDRGEFAFAKIPPGKYALNIDRTSIDIKKVTSIAMPLEVVVKGGNVTSVEIGLIQGCQLTGKLAAKIQIAGKVEDQADEVRLEDSASFMQNTSAEKLSNIIIELEQNGEVARRLTSNGEYKFYGLKPGLWNYKLFGEGLPENVAFKDPEGTIDLKPGDSEVLDFELIQRVKTIEFIDEGEVEVVRVKSD